MSNLPKIPISLQIRKIIFEHHNDTDKHFTNDDIFRILKAGRDIAPDWIVDDIEPYVNEICDSGMTRSIAQNFTTIWLKLFDVVAKYHCGACGFDVFLGNSEEKLCPNPSCRARL